MSIQYDDISNCAASKIAFKQRWHRLTPPKIITFIRVCLFSVFDLTFDL